MIDPDYELKIGDKLIKPKGELLSLTATEANKTYGNPAQSLLGAGIAKSIDELLTKKYGAGNYVIRQFQVTWSEELAQYLNAAAPILLGLGLLALFIEFMALWKTIEIFFQRNGELKTLHLSVACGI